MNKREKETSGEHRGGRKFSFKKGLKNIKLGEITAERWRDGGKELRPLNACPS